MCALESKEISSIRNLFGFSDYRHRSVDFWRRVPSLERAAVRKKAVTTLSRLMSLQQRSAIARRGNNGRLRWQSNLRYGHIAGEGSGRIGLRAHQQIERDCWNSLLDHFFAGSIFRLFNSIWGRADKAGEVVARCSVPERTPEGASMPTEFARGFATTLRTKRPTSQYEAMESR